MGKIAVYPGSFDPVTNGHCDIVRRGLRLFDKVIVAIARNGSKNPLFTIEQRLEMLRQSLSGMPGVVVDSFEGLLVDYVVKRQADAILRGLRAVSDFEYEFQMALMNRKLNKKVQTVFLMTGLRW
ncbi:MAG TPA: pantetheine-phosphate adenylyltransferase, partial [Desulfobacterales bacterium]|nr:pantetheine-phosphate adenylyltransferase [Desulfobacterales bacterium]